MSLLWVQASNMSHPVGTVVQVPVQEILRQYRPTEGDGENWDSVRDLFEDEHPVMMDSLRKDIGAQGVTRPIQAYADGDRWAIHNGHHRILAADDVGHPHVPVVHYEHPHDIPGDKEYWDPETRSHYGPDEDDHDEGQVRY